MTLYGETLKVLGMTGMEGRVEGKGVGTLIRLCVFKVDFGVGIISYLVFYFRVFVRIFSYLV
jgi:hypothetical protein